MAPLECHTPSISVAVRQQWMPTSKTAVGPACRSDEWLKMKRDYVASMRDTIDVVPIGAWYGTGRKHGWLSPFLLAVWDPERQEFQSLCR